MAKILNFNTVKKDFFTITLNDEKQTTLMIMLPTKSVLSELTSFQTVIMEVDENSIDPALLDDLYNVCAKIMSRNKTKTKITGEYLSKIFDYDDILLFYNYFLDFVNEVIDSKN